MEVKLTQEQIARLPIHDAVLHSFTIAQNKEGDLEPIMDIEITDRSYDPGYSYPEKENITRIIFKNTSVVRSNFYGRIANQDTFDRLEILEKSDLLTQSNEWPTPLPQEAAHYHVELHSGSTIDVVAEAIVLTAPSASDEFG